MKRGKRDDTLSTLFSFNQTIIRKLSSKSRIPKQRPLGETVTETGIGGTQGKDGISLSQKKSIKRERIQPSPFDSLPHGSNTITFCFPLQTFSSYI